MGLNVLVAAFNKYGFGKYTYKLGAGRTGTGTQVDCSALVQWSLKDFGYSIGTFNTNDPKIGLFFQQTGIFTDYAKQYFDEVLPAPINPATLLYIAIKTAAPAIWEFLLATMLPVCQYFTVRNPEQALR